MKELWGKNLAVLETTSLGYSTDNETLKGNDVWKMAFLNICVVFLASKNTLVRIFPIASVCFTRRWNVEGGEAMRDSPFLAHHHIWAPFTAMQRGDVLHVVRAPLHPERVVCL